jgi:hypothetical protein
MGLLDDAIREHLELKRQHGGDPAEIGRQEREAFGPVSRQAAPAEDEAAEVGDDAEAPEDATRVVPAADDVPAAYEYAPDEDVAPEADEPRRGAPFDAEEAPRDEIPPPPDAGNADHEEDPWLVEEIADPELEKEEDVLEETPDFLQETPEHDRLWFEQKPPRDFDWDK